MMNEKMHTPGPWELKRHNTKFEIHSDNDLIAYVTPSLLPEDADNLRLIAAAPDLLDLLLSIQAERSSCFIPTTNAGSRLLGWDERCAEVIARATQGDPTNGK